jgi:phenylacetate-coenzyme A ligase PaaK-like adenylate-forming protein
LPWNVEESLSRQELTKLQSERLSKFCERVYRRVPFHYTYGLFAEAIDEIVRIHASSRTTGKATFVSCTGYY